MKYQKGLLSHRITKWTRMLQQVASYTPISCVGHGLAKMQIHPKFVYRRYSIYRTIMCCHKLSPMGRTISSFFRMPAASAPLGGVLYFLPSINRCGFDSLWALVASMFPRIIFRNIFTCFTRFNISNSSSTSANFFCNSSIT